jgi:hypothetical protein
MNLLLRAPHHKPTLDAHLLITARGEETAEPDLRLEPVAGRAGPRARILAPDRRGVERRTNAESVEIAVVVGVRRTGVAAVAEGVPVGVRLPRIADRRAHIVAVADVIAVGIDELTGK